MRAFTRAVVSCLAWTAPALKLNDPEPADAREGINQCRHMGERGRPDTYGTAQLEPYVEQVLGDGDWSRTGQTDGDFSHLRNGNVLFVGDSTMEELMWDLVFTLNESPEVEHEDKNRPAKWTEVPAKQCSNQKCVDVCGGRDKGEVAMHYHFFGRCALGSTAACKKALPQLQKHNFTFSFLWSATPYVCCNGYPGLHGALHNDQWMDLFGSFAAGATYDTVIFTAGLHDFQYGGNQTEYQSALQAALGMLEPLAKRHVFLNPAGLHIAVNNINTEIVGKHPQWRVIDRSHFHKLEHCNRIRYDPSYFGYARSSECHSVVKAIFEADK